MIIYKEISTINSKLKHLRSSGKRIGFVPTMGALHKGHLSLIKESAWASDITVVSIFVNPVQFNDKKDFNKYPVTTENDIYLLETQNTNILFLPSVEEMYPEGLEFPGGYELGYLEDILEGHYRPDHFQGVCRVVDKLLNIIQPDNLFMGQKDYQQCIIIQKLIQLSAIPTSLNIIETERDKNGLAMSSRNLRLSQPTKQKASAIYKALSFIKNNLTAAPFTQLKEEAASIIINAGFEKIEYIEICDAKSLMPILAYDRNKKMIALAAAYIEGVRLIDNLLLNN